MTKGIRIQVYEADPIRWTFNLAPDATDCRQYRVSEAEWDRLKWFDRYQREIQKLLARIAQREEVEFEEAWEEEKEERDVNAKTKTQSSDPGD